MTGPHGRPDADADTLRAALAARFDLTGALRPLPGERDQNARLDTPDGRALVVKVTAPAEPDDLLAFESRLMAWLGERGTCPVPRIEPDVDGELVTRWPGADGIDLRIRVLEMLPGRSMAARESAPEGLLTDLGRRVGVLDADLLKYPDRPPHRPDFEWSLDRAPEVMERALDLLDGPRRRRIEQCLMAFRESAPRRSALARQIVHGDVNDHNVLVSATFDGPPRVTGLLDFGDIHEAPAVDDLAICAAYALFSRKDPLEALAAVVRGYRYARPLSPDEAALVLPLVRARLAASVCMAAWRRKDDPEPDPYLLVSEAPGWRALDALAEIPEVIVLGRVREACGLEPCPRAAVVLPWLADQECEPVVEPPPDRPGVTVLDLSVASPILTARDTDDTAEFTRRTFDAMHRAEAGLGLGRWGEPRGFYLTEAFAGRPSELPERRTVHLGIDVFVEAGAPVRAPLPGRVASVKDHDARLDYGPTVILEHDGPDGPFWTLYGHLERASVAGLAVGTPVSAATAFARVGPAPENGDWPPHLHLQILLDLMGFDGDFPGVASPRERRVWLSWCPDPSPLAGYGVEAAFPEPDDMELVERRREVLGPSLSLSYDPPIHVVRGRGAHLYDWAGREYLDGVNNVAHVGHEHPRVVDALAAQARVLNTNTRYLHPAVVEYAERLAALFPDPLSVVYLVNSGSEANELALRMARTATGRRGVVALEGGYHGHTQALIDVSHYKFSRKGGAGAPPWVRAAAMPDDFRGAFRRDDPERAERFAEDVGRLVTELAATSHGVGAFLAEPILSCGGQIVPPPGYLAGAYRRARAAGALCIADEVQIGFGRVGTHAWGFETHGVVPDIVTLGKPIGNGHPLGAVITTREIAEAFDNGMEFFSTFGGNPVSARVGLAVLDVLRDEGLQAHALTTGEGVLAGLRDVAERVRAIGDVRGRGLFLGVEFVRPGDDGPTPDARAARYVVRRAREQGVLLSTDGPDGNVVKFKPPLPFSAVDADRLIQAVEVATRELDGDGGAD